MNEPRRRRSVSQTLLLQLLLRQLASCQPPGASVVDVGGGTGTVAGALAAEGYTVRVVDPSPDALASLERRAHDAGLADRLTGLQGDATDLAALVGAGKVDAVVCHRVLEMVEAPAEALAAMAEVLRPDGVLSLVVAQRPAAVLGQALAGHFAQARRTAADPSRLDREQILGLVRDAGFQLDQVHGVGAVADHVPEALVDGDHTAYEQLLALETEVSADPAFQPMAPQLHVFARR
jgi:ubiquinone/menaquinone biosynthesis C-methylase UbiE